MLNKEMFTINRVCIRDHYHTDVGITEIYVEDVYVLRDKYEFVTFGATCILCTQLTIHKNCGNSRDRSYYQSNGVCAICIIASDHHVQLFWLDFNLMLHNCIYTKIV